VTTSTLQARDGATLDVARLSRINPEALVRFHDKLSSHSREKFWPHSYDAATIARLAARDVRGDDRIYVLRAAEDVVGYFFLWEFQDPVPVLGIGLADEWQGQGLGPRMIGVLVDDARATGRTGIDLTTMITNERAFRLYERVGFVGCGEVDNVSGDGQIIRERRMFLPLSPGAKPPVRIFKPPI
jgi:ribosomal protein S18 acetylase RimI-like enzyme